MIFLLLISGYFFVLSSSQPLLFPHGWFESKNLRPRDAIMLNMMAQSNLEYGGVTLEELDKLDAVRKVVPRPTDLARDREEDDLQLDREPIVAASSDTDGKTPNDGEAKLANSTKKTPFKRVNLKLSQKREVRQKERNTSLEENEESENPFEEIATRSPPKDYMYMRQLRHRSRKHKKKRRRYRENGFLTRDDIIKPKAESQPSILLSDRTSEKAEFDHNRRNIAQETWEREAKAAEKVRDDMARGIKEGNEPEPISPALKLLEKENMQLDAKLTLAEQSLGNNRKRLPNNPYNSFDIRKPTILNLPTPPPDDLSK